MYNIIINQHARFRKHENTGLQGYSFTVFGEANTSSNHLSLFLNGNIRSKFQWPWWGREGQPKNRQTYDKLCT